ncbi:MAG: PilZ domain-containing protein [Sphingomonas sp.]
MTDQPSANTRSRPPRKNLLLSATIEAGTLKGPVRMRNLSEAGAMLEGAALPDIGTTFTLRRLNTEIGGTVVWREAGRCGVVFDGKASVDAWSAGVPQAPRLGVRGQARVDEIQSVLRSGGQLPIEMPSATSPTKPITPGELNRRIAEEIDYAWRLLDAVGDEISDDPVLLQRHGDALQRFDIACQMISHLGAVVGAPDRLAAIESVAMADLRSRLLRKAIF